MSVERVPMTPGGYKKLKKELHKLKTVDRQEVIKAISFARSLGDLSENAEYGAVLVESFERIHRSNLVGMGVLPLQFKDGDNRENLGLDGTEIFDVTGIEGKIDPGQDVDVTVHYADGKSREITVLCRIDTLDEVDYYCHGGILQYVLRRLAS